MICVSGSQAVLPAARFAVASLITTIMMNFIFTEVWNEHYYILRKSRTLHWTGSTASYRLYLIPYTLRLNASKIEINYSYYASHTKKRQSYSCETNNFSLMTPCFIILKQLLFDLGWKLKWSTTSTYYNILFNLFGHSSVLSEPTGISPHKNRFWETLFSLIIYCLLLIFLNSYSPEM